MDLTVSGHLDGKLVQMGDFLLVQEVHSRYVFLKIILNGILGQIVVKFIHHELQKLENRIAFAQKALQFLCGQLPL